MRINKVTSFIFHNVLWKEILIILIIKVLAITLIWKLWFSEPLDKVLNTQQMEQQLLHTRQTLQT